MNVIDYITITCNLKKRPITDYIRLYEKCNRLQPIRITNYDYPMSGKEGQLSHLHVGNVLPHPTFLALNVRKA